MENTTYKQEIVIIKDTLTVLWKIRNKKEFTITMTAYKNICHSSILDVPLFMNDDKELNILEEIGIKNNVLTVLKRLKDKDIIEAKQCYQRDKQIKDTYSRSTINVCHYPYNVKMSFYTIIKEYCNYYSYCILELEDKPIFKVIVFLFKKFYNN